MRERERKCFVGKKLVYSIQLCIQLYSIVYCGISTLWQRSMFYLNNCFRICICLHLNGNFTLFSYFIQKYQIVSMLFYSTQHQLYDNIILYTMCKIYILYIYYIYLYVVVCTDSKNKCVLLKNKMSILFGIALHSFSIVFKNKY